MTSIAERYLSATNTSQLAVDPEHACDADRLLAAAYATAGDPRKSLALDVYRLRATSDMRGARAIAERMAVEVIQRSRPQHRSRASSGRPSKQPPTISRIEAVDLCITALKWWHMQTCPACEGRGHPRIPGTPHLDATRSCSHCHGTGARPLKKHVKPQHLRLAEWMAGALDELTALVFSDMLKRMPRFSD